MQEKSKARQEQKLFVIDGWKETKMALQNNFELQSLLCKRSDFENGFQAELEAQLVANKSNPELFTLSDEVFDKIAYRGNTSRVVSLAKLITSSLYSLKNFDQGIYIVLDGIEKPGNLGAILRIADAANVTAVLCSDIKTDIFNPNVIRSSVGCFFTQQIITESKESLFSFFAKHHIAVYTTSLASSENYLKCDYRPASAFVFGTEASGVQSFWEEHSTKNILIPMRGQNDSLNVSNSVAIILFEVLRQRAVKYSQ